MVAFSNIELQIQCWNIYGAFFNVDGDRYSKLQNDADFIGHTNKYLLFVLVETHHTASDIPQMEIQGYRCFQVCRKKLVKGPKSGGICVYVHESISRGVIKVNTAGSESILVKLNKDFFSFDRDVVVSFTYCVPYGSSYQTRTQFDPFDDFEEKLSHVKDDYDLICFGDYNARTAVKPDYIVDKDNSDIPVMESHFIPDTVAASPRGNMDKGSNSYGDRLLELCQSVPLRICNGRMFGDTVGCYTCYKHNGQSVVDYALVSPSIYDKVSSFVVNELLSDLSDHCSCDVTLKTNFIQDRIMSDHYEFIDKPKKIPWSDDISWRFENIIQTESSKVFLSNLAKQCLSSQDSLDTAVESLSSFLVSAARTAGGPVAESSRPRPPRRSSGPNWKFRKRVPQYCKPKWFDRTCESLQRQLRVTSRLLRQQPGNPYIKGRLVRETKDFKRVRKFKKKQYVDQMFVELDTLHKSNPRGYMDLVRSMRDGSFDKQVSDSTSQVSPDSWRNHFKGLLGPNVQPSPGNDEMSAFVQQNCDKARSCLDQPFTRTELLATIKGLKNNKAISFDLVSNEMLKTSKLIISSQLLIIFNSILKSTMYPSVWKKSILTPLHKLESLTDPSNFRGVAVNSCMGKLFNKLLQSRLEKKCIKEGLINNSQGSGKRGSRTADHLMIIRFLIDKYVTVGGKKLYSCFFDIRRAYDTVPRIQLFYSLLKNYHIGGNFLKILQEIYTQNEVYIKLSEGLCQPFYTTQGILQGDSCSPLLFNIFVNKISDIFDQTCDPVKINDTDQSCLLWSDDLFVCSQSAEGLQCAIDKVHSFYSSIGLQLNTKKTKILIFNKAGRVLTNHCFTLSGVQLEITDCYQYLGIKLRPSGSLTLAADELCAKARKAWFSISNLIYKD